MYDVRGISRGFLVRHIVCFSLIVEITCWQNAKIRRKQMNLLKKRIAAAPRFLLLICITPVLFLMLSVVFNFNLLALTLMLVGLLVAYIALTGGIKSKYLLMAWLAMMALICYAMLGTFRYHLNGPSGWEEFSNIYYAKGVLVTILSAIQGVLSLCGLIYLFKSSAAKAFYTR